MTFVTGLEGLVQFGEMPPSPAMKFSPRRELRVENHKQGRSFESGILFREKDDDLALFNEMQTKEKESFLLQSSDDFEDTFCIFLESYVWVYVASSRRNYIFVCFSGLKVLNFSVWLWIVIFSFKTETLFRFQAWNPDSCSRRE